MSVHRISGRSDFLLRRIAASENRKPAQVLDQLVRDYAAGLVFDDPDLDTLPAPHAEPPVR